ncbi:MAG: CTP synthase, partial [Gammaproteobacteria bacterium]
AEKSMFMHLTLVPYIKAAGEIKTKPTQHSVKELRSIGIQADVLLCRSEAPLPESDRRKIALFTNVPEKAVISAIDVDTIYKLPMWLHQQGLDDLVVSQLKLDAKPANLVEWERTVDAIEHPKHEVNIAIIGKYVEHKDAYKSLSEALRHGGLKQSTHVNLQWMESEEIEARGPEMLHNVDGILVPGGFGKRGFEGKIAAAKFARESKIPYFGICYGMHAAVVDFARNIAGLPGANSSENDRHCVDPVIALITEWTTASGAVETRSEESDLGGTMRLGAQECKLTPGTLAREMYGQEVIRERHRHRYEFNNNYRKRFEELGLVVSGTSMDDLLVEMIEFSPQKHPWFVAGQFHPEFTSTPRDGHPLFNGFIQAARDYRAVRTAPRLAEAVA